MDHAHRGEAALSSSNFKAAVEHYTLALESAPESPVYYLKRSTAYSRSGQHDLALPDADKAVVLATKRQKRELIAQAQQRRGIALFNVGQHANAKFCLGLAKKLDGNIKGLDMWMAKCEQQLKRLSEGDEAIKITVTETPAVKIETPKASTKQEHKEQNGTTAPAATVPSQTPKEKIRHEWYQNNENVTITILAKGVPKDEANIVIQSNLLDVSFPLQQAGSSYEFSLEPLFAPIDAEASKYRILSTKIEITLKKQTPGQKWAKLEGDSTTTTMEAGSSGAESGPAYPTSSRSGPKNWEKIAQSYQRPPEKHKKEGEEEKEDVKGKAEDDMYIDEYDDEGDPANAFFKKLYSGADPDTRRAMMKSYQESGGTALSTDWSEVKKQKVEVSPPEGMEEKKW